MFNDAVRHSLEGGDRVSISVDTSRHNHDCRIKRASPEFGMADWRAAVRQVEGHIKQNSGTDWRQ